MRYVGLDWASEAHDFTIIDDTATIIDRWSFSHDEAGITAALARLAGHGTPGDLPVAIETSNGLLVERLLSAGHPIVPIHPNAFNATRPRWGASRAKTDPGDSYKLADYLRTEGHRLRRLTLPDEATRDLQQLVRLRDDHVAAKVACTNQLAALLARHWPGAGTLFAPRQPDRPGVPGRLPDLGLRPPLVDNHDAGSTVSATGPFAHSD